MNSTLYINLQKIGANLEAVEKQLHPKVKKMAVIKDNAYGHGMIPVARYLKDRADWFCVATVDEAIELRDAGIKNPLLVFGVPTAENAAAYNTYNLTASISDLSVFELLPAGTRCHLQFDTGMYRLGILPEDVAPAIDKVQKFDNLKYTGIFTHFANTDDPGHESVRKQLEVFRSIRSEFPAEWMAHTANSGGVFFYKDLDLQFDGVRPGICLYGYAPGNTPIPGLEPVVEWKSKLSQVKKVYKGDKVGYGSRWEAPEDGWLGIVPAGYGQGIKRNLSGQIRVQVNGELYPQVGTVSMDYIAVFLGNKKKDTGSEVTLLGSGELSAKVWAGKIGTIPYEITTGLSGIAREYIG